MDNENPNVQAINQMKQKDSRMWSMFCHLSTLLGLVVPLGNIFGPLLIWQIKKDEFPETIHHGKEALNFQISMTIYLIVSGILVLLLIGIAFLIILGILDIVFTIIAAVKANEGVRYRYPMTIRFVK